MSGRSQNGNCGAFILDNAFVITQRVQNGTEIRVSNDLACWFNYMLIDDKDLYGLRGYSHGNTLYFLDDKSFDKVYILNFDNIKNPKTVITVNLGEPAIDNYGGVAIPINRSKNLIFRKRVHENAREFTIINPQGEVDKKTFGLLGNHYIGETYYYVRSAEFPVAYGNYIFGYASYSSSAYGMSQAEIADLKICNLETGEESKVQIVIDIPFSIMGVISDGDSLDLLFKRNGKYEILRITNDGNMVNGGVYTQNDLSFPIKTYWDGEEEEPLIFFDTISTRVMNLYVEDGTLKKDAMTCGYRRLVDGKYKGYAVLIRDLFESDRNIAIRL